MGAHIGGGGMRAGGRAASGRYKPLAEINVTPFVDVMLVLLVVFMITAPLLTAGVQVDLPKASVKNLPKDDKPLEIAIDQNGAIFMADTAISDAELIPRLEAIAGTRRDLRIYVRGDRRLEYGRVMQIIGAINKAGFLKVALVADTSGK